MSLELGLGFSYYGHHTYMRLLFFLLRYIPIKDPASAQRARSTTPRKVAVLHQVER